MKRSHAQQWPDPPPQLGSEGLQLTDREFCEIRDFVAGETGIVLKPEKSDIIATRLTKRLTKLGLTTVTEYMKRVYDPNDPAERTHAIHILTNHETYFFRCPKQFDKLRSYLLSLKTQVISRPIRIWSAASSTGEEAYSLAMTAASALGWGDWDLCASDVSEPALAKARRGLYPMKRIDFLKDDDRVRYFLRGRGASQGMMLVKEQLRKRVDFRCLNLCGDLPDLGQFDVIFLRNVLIYFSSEKQQQIVRRVVTRLRAGGLLFLGTAEASTKLHAQLELLGSSVFRKLKISERAEGDT